MSLRANKFLLVTVFISCYAFVACKKKDTLPPLQTGAYTYDKVGDIGSVRMFTLSGEIKDQNLINKYKARFADQLNPDSLGASQPFSFSVIDENSVKVEGVDFSVAKMDNYYQFRSIDTVKYPGNYSYLPYNLVKYKPYHGHVQLPASSGSTILNTTFNYLYVSPAANGVVYPIINYFDIVHYGPTPDFNTYTYIGQLNNVFDDKFQFPVNTITEDTLIVQTYNWYFKK